MDTMDYYVYAITVSVYTEKYTFFSNYSSPNYNFILGYESLHRDNQT